MQQQVLQVGFNQGFQNALKDEYRANFFDKFTDI
jgi:hypothetical protein